MNDPDLDFIDPWKSINKPTGLFLFSLTGNGCAIMSHVKFWFDAASDVLSSPVAFCSETLKIGNQHKRKEEQNVDLHDGYYVPATENFSKSINEIFCVLSGNTTFDMKQVEHRK
ncbi:D-ribulose-5-phosphate-3-epimerase [Striga asiatica]|uniref:D-ribulose-5-phosphate-3-epimerase n=1 Tax=Striga asiatica TaxID=4170 RepID=A0A5A7QSY2_STRAF|nr:D-ribulose-5-phosphate-3-epimerase [Striga asiatica]